MFGFIRKSYIKARVYLYSKRRFFNSIAVFAMTSTLIYLFINSFIFERVIIAKAQDDEINNKWEKALDLYTIASIYYGINHFSQDNKEIYFSIPYKKAICNLRLNNQKKSIESIFIGMVNIHREYGVLSRESALFSRKYLIEYYLNNNNIVLAKREFATLLEIYRTIGYKENEMSDIIRISGDLCYQQKLYTEAMDFYEKAYKDLLEQKHIDYEIFSKIVYRMCDYQVASQKKEIAEEIYKSAIMVLENAGRKEAMLTANMYLHLGALYANEEDNNLSKKAIEPFEKAIKTIKTLPRVNYMRQNIKQYLTTLKDLYQKNNQYSQAQEVELELTKIKRFTFLD